MEPTPFILPAWHVVFVHYPLALLSIGLILEFAAFAWPAVRQPARWMILLGALSCLPTLTTGLHAFRDAVGGSDDSTWAQRAAGNQLAPEPFALMRRHIWLACDGSAIALAAVIAFLAASDNWRRRLHLPCLLAVTAAVLLLFASAWHAGDAVFRLGTGVEKLPPPSLSLASAFPPIELHMFLAGCAAALALLTFSLTTRGLSQQPAPPARTRWWIALLCVALSTFLAGAWTSDILSPTAFFTTVAWSNNHRFCAHALLGAAIILLPLLFALLARRQKKHLLPIGAMLLLLLLAAQIWMGVLLTCDSSDGPLTRFNPPSAAPAP